MIWLTWRQHRAEVLALTLTVAVIGGILVLFALPIHAALPDAAACLNSTSDACKKAFRVVNENQLGFGQIVEMLVVLPLVIGLFLGAPLLAREYEQGTWQLAWTQGVPRMRWLAVKLAALASATVVLAAAFTAVRSWANEPTAALMGQFDDKNFDLAGVVPSAYALFAFATAAAAGVLLRRSLPALGIAVVVFVVVRVTVRTWLRPNFQAPLTQLSPAAGGHSTPHPHDWAFNFGYVDATGHRISDARYYELLEGAAKGHLDESTYLTQQGIRAATDYQPHDRFWAFQWTEAAIYVGLSALLLAVVVWRVRRRG
jgi:hypothetical protein